MSVCVLPSLYMVGVASSKTKKVPGEVSVFWFFKFLMERTDTWDAVTMWAICP